jgi:hypothetical protein
MGYPVPADVEDRGEGQMQTLRTWFCRIDLPLPFGGLAAHGLNFRCNRLDPEPRSRQPRLHSIGDPNPSSALVADRSDPVLKLINGDLLREEELNQRGLL